jgi:hypothetical protein
LKKQSQFLPGGIGIKAIMTRNYENVSDWTPGENKANQSQFVFLTAENAEFAEQKVCNWSHSKETPSPSSPRSLRSLRLMPNAHLSEPDLKKQSQFVLAQIGAKAFMKGDYGNIPRGGLRKNKAKQSQFPPFFGILVSVKVSTALRRPRKSLRLT